MTESCPDTSIYLESSNDAPHQWTLWVDGQPTRFRQPFDLYTAIDIATAFLAERGTRVEWHGPIPPDYGRYYMRSRRPVLDGIETEVAT